MCSYRHCLFFFFQAEDGIRDWSVTGVQTCALPISTGSRIARGGPARARRGRGRTTPWRPRRERQQIGRASCRERVGRRVGGGSFKKKKKERVTRGGCE